jgi:hypothetical protein
MDKIDFTFIFPSFFRHTKQMMYDYSHASKALLLAGLYYFKSPSQRNARGTIDIVCSHIRSHRETLSATCDGTQRRKRNEAF